MNLLQYCFCFYILVFGPEACRILAPRPGIKPSPLALEGEALTTGPSGKSIPSPPLPCMFMLMPSGLPHHTHTHTHTHTPGPSQFPQVPSGFSQDHHNSQSTTSLLWIGVRETISQVSNSLLFYFIFFNIMGYPGGLAIENPLTMQETHET